jgi:hypothetical protein
MPISISLRSLCRTPVIVMPSTAWKQTRVRPFNRRIGTRARTLFFFVFGGPNRVQLQVCVVYRVPVVVYVSGFTHFPGCRARSNPNPNPTACRFHLTGSRPISLGFFPPLPPHLRCFFASALLWVTVYPTGVEGSAHTHNPGVIRSRDRMSSAPKSRLMTSVIPVPSALS